jgi:hypothetical protein
MNRKIAVDFDGTISFYEHDHADGGYDPSKVGEPIPRMCDRVREWLADGDEVVVLTARVWSGHSAEEIAVARKAVGAFCLEQFGRELEVTSEKDPHIEVIYDDKAVGVTKNLGGLVGCGDEGSDEDQIGAFLFSGVGGES